MLILGFFHIENGTRILPLVLPEQIRGVVKVERFLLSKTNVNYYSRFWYRLQKFITKSNIGLTETNLGLLSSMCLSRSMGLLLYCRENPGLF